MPSIWNDIPSLQGPPDITAALQMLSEGLAERRKQKMIEGIGQRIGSGDFQGAAETAFASGDLQSGLKIHELDLQGKKQFAQMVEKYTLLADTPEKWERFRPILTELGGGEDPGDFETGRPALIAEFADVDNIIAANESATDNARDDERLRMEQERLRIAQETADREAAEAGRPKPDKGFRYKDDGVTQEYIPGGPEDPVVIKQQVEARTAAAPPRSRVLPQNALNALSEAGASYDTFARLTGTWDDRYGGFVIPGAGSVSNWMGRNSPLASQEQVDAAAWWQDYQNQKNLIRNKLFGSALTATEKAEFDKANIDPSMRPDQIRKNLARQNALATKAARKMADVYIQQKYDPGVIQAGMGVSLEALGLGDLIAGPSEPEDPLADDNPPAGFPEPDLWRFLDPEERQQYLDAEQ